MSHRTLIPLIARRLRRILLPTEMDRAYARWVADRGEQTLRLTYPLTAESLVVDVGGYEGQWASDIVAMYECTVLVFEPVRSFAEGIRRRFRQNPRIRVFAEGLAGVTRDEDIHLHEDATSTLRQGGPSERIRLVAVSEIIARERLEQIDLVKVNIEGGEYELLEAMLLNQDIARIGHLQVQFHDLGADAVARREAIAKGLAQTHRRTWCYPFIWENWERLPDAVGVAAGAARR